MHVGAQTTREGVTFRVWAPGRRRVQLVIEGRVSTLAPENEGYFSAHVRQAQPGMHYQYLLDDDPRPLSGSGRTLSA